MRRGSGSTSPQKKLCISLPTGTKATSCAPSASSPHLPAPWPQQLPLRCAAGRRAAPRRPRPPAAAAGRPSTVARPASARTGARTSRAARSWRQRQTLPRRQCRLLLLPLLRQQQAVAALAGTSRPARAARPASTAAWSAACRTTTALWWAVVRYWLPAAPTLCALAAALWYTATLSARGCTGQCTCLTAMRLSARAYTVATCTRTMRAVSTCCGRGCKCAGRSMGPLMSARWTTWTFLAIS